MPKVPQLSALPKLSNLLESAKRAAAYKAVDENLDFAKHRILGIGSGSTVVYVAERIGQYLLDPDYRQAVSEFICVPTGFQSRKLILGNGLRLGSVEEYPEIDISFDGADEVSTDLDLIKGGGGCLFQEKLVSVSSKKYVIVADYTKRSPNLLGTNWRRGVPVEVVPIAYARVIHDLKALGAQNITLREGGKVKAGPVLTDNGNFIVDVDFGKIENPRELDNRLKMVLGVVESGIFTGLVDKVYFGNPDGTVEVVAKDRT